MTGIHAFMTNQMKDDLRACGFSEEQLAQLTPQEGDEILAAVVATDVREVRESVATIVGQAREATRHLSKDGGDPGILQMVLVHPLSDDVGTIYRYALDDPELGERMTREAVSASEAGHNVYVEARTVRRGLSGKQRGGLADTVAVFALVVDSDSDKGKAWTPTVPISVVVATSPGNHHHWMFFETALDPATAQALGARLRAATNADSDTGNPCQPYRLSGTVNYPNKYKLERGRVVTPTRTLSLDDTLWTPERFEQEFPATAPKRNGGGNGHRPEPEESSIPADTLQEIQAQDTGKRGTRFWNVMIVLKSLGYTIDGIVALFEKYPDGIAAKYRGRLRHQVETVWAKLSIGDPKPTPTDITVIKVLSQADFLASFVPPDYLVDGVLQRRFIYSLTAVTGHGKTTLALLLAQAVGSTNPNARFGSHAVEKGRVVYFVGENPDDVRCRLIGANAERSDDANLDRIHYIAGVFDIAGLHEQLVAAIDKLGGVDLVLVDTSAAYFLKDDENSNPQMGAHARVLRTLTTLPGGPCVLVLCHPIKHVTDPSQLLPRGGGAFMAEMDGNLTLWKHDENLITFHHSDKFRGPGFEPITFKLEKITTDKLVDRKGRKIPTVHAVAISEQEEEAQEASAERDEDQLLAELAKNPKRSIADLARACGWLLADDEPHKSKVDRVLKRLQADKLVKRVRGKHWQVTDAGKELLEEEEEEERAEDRSGAPGGKKVKPFHALRGMKQRPTVPCAYCGTTGEVYKIADGRVPLGQRHHADLHAGCAEAYFTGKPSPKPKPGAHQPPDPPSEELDF
jgi:DNA-binding MarR family transcriptional regulator